MFRIMAFPIMARIASEEDEMFLEERPEYWYFKHPAHLDGPETPVSAKFDDDALASLSGFGKSIFQLCFKIDISVKKHDASLFSLG